jgi:hypothetical protein
MLNEQFKEIVYKKSTYFIIFVLCNFVMFYDIKSNSFREC